jgi:hypothetical protein
MSVPEDSNGGPDGPSGGPGVLANLPRTRPQRSTARRTAARKAGSASAAEVRPSDDPPARVRITGPSRSAKAAANAGKPKPQPKPRAKAKPRAAARSKRAAATPVGDPVPMQGFESDGDRATRGPVQPPGGAELAASAAEMFGELAKAGLSTGERLLRDVLSRLPLN